MKPLAVVPWRRKASSLALIEDGICIFNRSILCSLNDDTPIP